MIFCALTSPLLLSTPPLQGKYVEAEIAKNRLDELKLHEENRRRVSACVFACVCVCVFVRECV
jgi:hypothetical protein